MHRPGVVVCDDEELIRSSIGQYLEQNGFRAYLASDGVECLERVKEHAPAAVLMDLRMPRKDGLTTLRELRQTGHELPVIVLTAHGGVDSAIEATKLGASDYLTKPFDLRQVLLSVEKAIERDRLEAEAVVLRRRRRRGYGGFIGRSSALAPLFETLSQLEGADAPTVLIMGESGTGKDVLAREIHARGPRRTRPFVDIDCASLPEHLIESALFGHEKGAFTDAKQRKQGLFEVAHNGVVFLDEIGEMPAGLQVKLLRALETRSFRRVGGTVSHSFDVALVAATNRNLQAEVAAGNFREDLYFRLAVIPLRVPALRDRRDDVPLLVEHFVSRFAEAFKRDITGFDDEAMSRLVAYDWPGNVRELRNLVERCVILGEGPVLSSQVLPMEIQGGDSDIEGPFVLPEEGLVLDEVERGLIEQALARTGGNRSAAGRLLGISRYALRHRMKKFELS